MAANAHQERTLLWPPARLLLGDFLFEVFGTQVVRVLLHAHRDCAAVRDPPGIVAAFHRLGLIPAGLLELSAAWTYPHPENPPGGVPLGQVLGVCFAASAFPQRAFQMGQVLAQRGECFRDFLQALAISPPKTLADPTQVADYLTSVGRLPATVSRSTLLELFSDLSAAELAGARPAPSAQQEKEERVKGGALYLTTCHSELLARMLERWPEEAGFVCYLRRTLSSPPTDVIGGYRQAGGGYPDWKDVASRLQQKFPHEGAAHHAIAARREADIWMKAIQFHSLSQIPQDAVRFWNDTWHKLSSGFPYYAFQAHFTPWWRQCLSTFDFSGPAQGRNGESGSPEPSDLFRSLREIYRVVRVTFFPRTVNPGAAAEETELYRRVLDALWYRRLEGRIHDDTNLPAEQVQQIAHQFNEQGTHVVNMMSHRLRLRVWAGSLARLQRWRNSQIRSARRASRNSAGDTERYPLAREPAVLLVATVCRSVPETDSLFGPFTAHVFVYPTVRPQRPDPWTFPRYVRELWWWVKEEGFEEAIRQAAADGSRANRSAIQILQKGASLADLWRALRDLSTEADLEEYLRYHQPFAAEHAEARAVLQVLVGDDGQRACCDATLRQGAARAGRHWVVPVWYLMHVERLAPEELVTRLLIDPDEVQAVLRLARGVAPPPSTGGSGASREGTP